MWIGVHTSVELKVLTLQGVSSSFLLRRQTAGWSDPACVDSWTESGGRVYLSILAPATRVASHLRGPVMVFCVWKPQRGVWELWSSLSEMSWEMTRCSEPFSGWRSQEQSPSYHIKELDHRGTCFQQEGSCFPWRWFSRTILQFQRLRWSHSPVAIHGWSRSCHSC